MALPNMLSPSAIGGSRIGAAPKRMLLPGEIDRTRHSQSPLEGKSGSRNQRGKAQLSGFRGGGTIYSRQLV
jgi:hypothetical protein